MIRKALLIGNTNGLEGVKVDLSNFADFLESDYGGGWISDEIEILYDIAKSDLYEKLSKLKKIPPDLLIIVFSGHGGQERKTILELNSFGETIEENQLRNIATRQIIIYDCCRSFPESYYEEENLINFFKSTLTESRRKNIRLRYEERILNSSRNQQILLYSCKIE
jgi:glyoxylase-like metal-dependent hydrolase (beta-lactamase superfamily II)